MLDFRKEFSKGKEGRENVREIRNPNTLVSDLQSGCLNTAIIIVYSV